jgi:hypothetical protein
VIETGPERSGSGTGWKPAERDRAAVSVFLDRVAEYRTAAEAVSSEVPRQLDRPREGVALLAGEGMAEKVSEQRPILPPPRRLKRV